MLFVNLVVLAVASAITCSSMALVNAGIPMYDIVIGSSLVSFIFCSAYCLLETISWSNMKHYGSMVSFCDKLVLHAKELCSVEDSTSCHTAVVCALWINQK